MLRDTPLTMDSAQPPGDTRDALIEAARTLLTRGNVLRQTEHGTLELRAGVGQRNAAGLACVGLDSAQGRLLIALEREQAVNPLGDARWQDYVGETRLLAWSLAHEPMLEALAHVFGGGFVATGFFAAGAEVDCLWLALEWRDEDGQSLQGWLGLGATETRLLAACTDWKRDPSRLSMLGDAAELSFDLLLQGRVLDPAATTALQPGDVLLVGESADCDGQLRADRETARSMFGLPAGWTVLRRQGRWTVAARPSVSTAADAHRPQFRVARLSLTPDEVGALQPGSVLSYDSSLVGNTVEIFLGERRFGEGVLVALGEWLGVRITSHDLTQKDSAHGLQ
jgi:type III secretion protein Q